MRKPLIFFLLLFAAAIIFLWVYFPVISKYRELKQQQDKVEHEIKDLDARIEALVEERRLLQEDHNYLEKVIREELGLVKPGEIIYKMIPDTTVPARPASGKAPAAAPAAASKPEVPAQKTVVIAPKPAPKHAASAH